MKVNEKLLRRGDRYLLRIEGTGIASTLLGEQKTTVSGELILQVKQSDEHRKLLLLERCVIASTDLKMIEQSTGVLSIIGEETQGFLDFDKEQGQWQLNSPAKIHYPDLDRQAGKQMDRGCYHQPTFLPAGIWLSGKIIEAKERLFGSLMLKMRHFPA